MTGTQKVVTFVVRYKVVTYPLFLLLLILIALGYVRDFFPATHTITVVGVGDEKVKLDKASVSFSVVVAGATQADVIANGEQKFNGLLAAVGSYKPDVDKTTYQVVQNTTNPSAAQAYQYVNAAKLTISDASKVSDLVKALYSGGATVVSQPVYIPANQNQVDSDVRALAVRNAQSQAQQIARASGAALGRADSIQDNGSTGKTGTSVTGTTASSGENLLNSTGQVEVQAVVTVVYELR
jgi:uncharacterized protein YggE